MNTQLVPKNESGLLPPILAGRTTPAVRERVSEFFFSLASLFEAWVTRRQSVHTQRAYREDIMSFVKFMNIKWPDDSTVMLSVSIRDVLRFHEHLVERNAAPKTINRRISSISSFYKYLAAAAAETDTTPPFSFPDSILTSSAAAGSIAAANSIVASVPIIIRPVSP